MHNSAGEKQLTSGEKSVDNQSFFARVAQRVIHFLKRKVPFYKHIGVYATFLALDAAFLAPKSFSNSNLNKLCVINVYSF